MKEELYIYTKDGVRKNIDLNTPSGITLKWVSNLFNSLDKVNCSYSYTFNIPMTRHNREVFDNAEDVRHISNLLGYKMKCEYIQNGIPLFENANFYISECKSGKYSCVFTWGVLDGLQKLKDDGCSLNELRDALIKAGVESDELSPTGVTDWNYLYNSPDAFSNTAKTLHPSYVSGVPYNIYEMGYNVFSDVKQFSAFLSNNYSPRPVMPVPYILSMIEKAFGVKFNLATTKAGRDSLAVMNNESNWYKENNIINFGCIPFVNSDLTKKQLETYTINLDVADAAKGQWFIFSGVRFLGQENVIKFGTEEGKGLWEQGKDNYLTYLYLYTAKSYDDVSSSYVAHAKVSDNYSCCGLYSMFQVKLEGKLVARVNKKFDTTNDNDRLSIVVFTIKGGGFGNNTQSIDEVTTIKAYIGNNVYDYSGHFQYAEFVFNFQEKDGFDSVTIGDEDDGLKSAHYYFFRFNKPNVQIVEQTPFKATPMINDAVRTQHKMDTFTNLPDIDCLTFVKSLFYMLGSYPTLENGTIKASSYNVLKDNIKKGYVYNWSDNVLSRVQSPESISFNASDFKKSNYFMTKWDDLDRTADDLEEEEDVYEDGILNVRVENENLDDEQTVFQLPFYPPYILNRKSPNVPTGNTIKTWSSDNTKLEYSTNLYGRNPQGWIYAGETAAVRKMVTMTESKPAYGILHCKPYVSAETGETLKDINGKDITALRMSILNPFKNADFESPYSYFQEIMKHPFVVKENLILDELQLMNIDFTKTVYLDKYSSYFAIVSIQRSSKGVCKCELIKLPTE